MEQIVNFFDSVPNWLLFMVVGVVLAFIVISMFKKGSFITIILVVVIILLLFGVDFKQAFQSVDTQALKESFEFEQEDEGGSIFERIFQKTKEKRDELVDDDSIIGKADDLIDSITE